MKFNSRLIVLKIKLRQTMHFCKLIQITIRILALVILFFQCHSNDWMHRCRSSSVSNQPTIEDLSLWMDERNTILHSLCLSSYFTYNCFASDDFIAHLHSSSENEMYYYFIDIVASPYRHFLSRKTVKSIWIVLIAHCTHKYTLNFSIFVHKSIFIVTIFIVLFI